MSFTNVNVDLDIDKRKVGYGDFRDWFILENRPVHETELQLFINEEQVHKSLFPINTKQIVCNIQAGVDCQMPVEYVKWKVPEMGISSSSKFPSIYMAGIGDTLNIDLTIEINMSEGD